MTQRLPIPGGDSNSWGAILNGFLEVSHNSDGTLVTSAVTNALPNPIPLTYLGSGTPLSSTFLRGDGTWAAPNAGSSALANDTDVSLSTPSNNQVLAYNGSLWVNESLTEGNISNLVSDLASKVELGGDIAGTTAAPTLSATSNVESIIAANTTVAGALQKAHNLSDVADSGVSRANIHIPTLTPAACVVTTNVASLAGLTTYDGYSLTTGDIVLLSGQSSGAQNGLWTAASGAWTRPSEMSSGSTVNACTVAIIQGTAYGGSTWLLQTNASITVDAAAQVWVPQLPGSVVSGSGANNPLMTEGGTSIVNLPTFQPNVAYPAGFVIQQNELLYARSTAGTAGASWSADSSNWILLQSNVPVPTQANQIIVSSSSDIWTLASVGTIASTTYTSSYNVSTSDLGIEDDYSSSTNGTATIPVGLTTSVGAVVAFRQIGSGTLTVAGASGVTVEGTLTTAGPYQTLMARQIAVNTWAVTGSNTGGSGSGLASIPSWAASTNYTADQLVLSPAGSYGYALQSLVQATTSFESGSTFSPANWERVGDLANPASASPLWLPYGAIADNFPRWAAAGQDITPTSGTPYIFPGPFIAAGSTVGHVNFYQSAAAPSGQTHAWVALLSLTGTVLAVTADAGSTVWINNTFVAISIALSASYTPSAGIQTLACLCVVATGMGTWRGINPSNIANAWPSAALGSGKYLTGYSTETGQTTPPLIGGTVPLPTSSTGIVPYFFVS